MEYIEKDTKMIINKPHTSIIFLGHVDHGKSTICGNILYSLGLVDERRIQKLKEDANKNGMSSWWLAYVMDQFEEEKEKGKTIEVGYATFETEKKRYTILDAPGHKEYINSTICGLAHADCAIIVTSARFDEFDDGFTKGGQIKEHILLAKSMNIEKLIVLVNKMDDSSVNWLEIKYTDIKNKILEYIQKTKLGFKNVVFIPVSGLYGDNLMSNSHKCLWYNGKNLRDTLDTISQDIDNKSTTSIISVMDRYEEGNRIYIVGRVENGVISKNDKLYLLPSANNKICTIDKINSEFVSENCDIININSGEHLTLIIKTKGIIIDDINPGTLLCSNINTILPSCEIKAEIMMLTTSDNLKIITSGTQMIMHLKTLQTNITIKHIDGKIFIKKGEVCKIIFVTSKPICCSGYKNIKSLSRFVLRYDNITVCIGRVIGVKSVKKN
jgi:peptide chain release factor subunit 3